MKKILLALLCVGLINLVQSQVVFSEDFQIFANSGDFPTVAEPDDAEPEDWVNVDLDNLEANAGFPQDWYGDDDFRYDLEDVVGDTNFIMASRSWLVGFAPGNRNYLIMPELEVTANMTLTFEVSAFQGPRYQDGMSVVVSPDGDMTDLEVNFSDYLFREAQMVEDVSWNADYYPNDDYTGCSANNGLDIASYCWYPSTLGDGTGGTGYVHADSYTLTDYFLPNDDNYMPTLEPHTVSLADYVGETIRIAFLHDSDDDNLLGLDNIVVEMFTGIEEFSFDQLVEFYPNPASNYLHINFSEFVENTVEMNVIDTKGSIVMSRLFGGNEITLQQNLDISTLPAGIYNMQLNIDNAAAVSKTFIKK